MQVVVKGKNIDVTDSLRDYAARKVQKIEKFFGNSEMDAQVTLKVERGQHIVDVTVQVDGLLLRGEEKTGDMYASIDGVVDKIERQIKKYKTKINRKLRQQGAKLTEAAFENGDAPVVEREPRVVRTKRFAIKPMSLEEAMMQMELLGHDFFVFSNADTEEVNVLYRRKDGDYGLIEPEF
jgi:putative sigma-54 modulation protein